MCNNGHHLLQNTMHVSGTEDNKELLLLPIYSAFVRLPRNMKRKSSEMTHRTVDRLERNAKKDNLSIKELNLGFPRDKRVY
jgi:hypothetical protein